MNWLDLTIILTYLVGVMVFGFWVSRRASKSIKSYFLGDNSMPWYLLGLSNASGMFDISGVMWSVTIFVVYGLKSAWIPWLWPVWNQIFVLAFLAIWIRRSNVLTGAEWIHFRFGKSRGGSLSHVIVSVFALVSTIGFVSYFFVGIGKFAAIFFPWDLSCQFLGLFFTSEQSYACIVIALTCAYVIKGGMYSVVVTEVLQFIIMTVSCVFIAWVAWSLVDPEDLRSIVPRGWDQLFFGWDLGLNWKGGFEALQGKIESDGFELFGALFLMMLFKGLFASLAGPVPSYDLQRILSTRTPREAAKMGGLTTLVLFFPRYLMIGAFGIIALVYVVPDLVAENNLDFELALPITIHNYLPAGVKGLLIAGLLAAFMGTFAAFVNAAPAYFVNDIYKVYVNPHASEKKYVQLSYISSFVLVILGVIGGFFAESVNALTLWITSSLFGGYAMANVLKWIWWRFNGHGYFWGMLCGLVAATVVPPLLPHVIDIYLFPIILSFSLFGSLLGTLLSPAQPMAELIHFYDKTRPWGFWKPVRLAMGIDSPPREEAGSSFRLDAFNVVTGVVWQMTMVVGPFYLLLRNWTAFAISCAVFLITSGLVKLYWWDRLPKE